MRRWFAMGLVMGAATLATAAPLERLSVAPQPAETLRLAPRLEPSKMKYTGLVPAVPVRDLCGYHYRVSTQSAECQYYVDQAFGYYYSYVWMEAARSFETALQYDPNCAIAWWGLQRGLEKWGRWNHTEPLKQAQALLSQASHRERLLITSRLQEKGLLPGVTPEQRKPAAAKTLDELLVLYDDDQEAWFHRAQLSDGPAAIPYYKALLRLNPLHPGANHELVHYYENIRRPALGWPYAEKYIESSPGLPHAFHMQAHLATRLGKWSQTSDRSARAIELERAYHKLLGVKPTEDHQFSHHLEILTLSLIHDGRFAEARVIQREAEGYGYKHWLAWFRLFLAENDTVGMQRVIDHYRKSNKTTAAYLAAVSALARHEPKLAAPEIEIVRQAQQQRKNDAAIEYQFLEVNGLYLCQTGAVEEGLKLLARAADKSKDDFRAHSWGNGAYLMEVWGQAALAADKLDEAEEAFLEALAHDPGSARGAFGLQVICDRQNRLLEAERYHQLALRAWARATPQHRAALHADLQYRQLPRWLPGQPVLSTPGGR